MGGIAALFDMDLTLLDRSSGMLYVRYQLRNGRMRRRDAARAMWWGLLSRIGLLDMHNLIPRMIVGLTGDSVEEARTASNQWFADDVAPHIAQRGRQRVEEHRAEGHVVAIVSGSTQFAVGPMAEHLGIPGQYVCTRLESRDGRLTGQVVPPVCYGPGKVVWAERFADEHGVDLSASYFYTDSITDLPLLERVAHPVAVNPDPRLRRLAQTRGWPVETFF
jgi:HAD superfamily hydrolase (TIGR01490 family)